MKFDFNLEDIKYLKITYRDYDNNTCNIKVAVKTIDEREIHACMRCENEFLIRTPQSIILNIVCVDGLYTTKTMLKSISNEFPFIFFIIETPQGIEHQQNREYFRILGQYKCKYTINNPEETKSYEGKTYDISANGISFITEDYIIPEEDSELSIDIEGYIITTGAKYIRTDKLDNGYKFSFMYTNISEADRDIISKICIQKQLEQKRNILS